MFFCCNFFKRKALWGRRDAHLSLPSPFPHTEILTKEEAATTFDFKSPKKFEKLFLMDIIFDWIIIGIRRCRIFKFYKMIKLSQLFKKITHVSGSEVNNKDAVQADCVVHHRHGQQGHGRVQWSIFIFFLLSVADLGADVLQAPFHQQSSLHNNKAAEWLGENSCEQPQVRGHDAASKKSQVLHALHR